MNRRRFLAMSAAGGAVLSAGKFGIHPTVAQAPQYELVDLAVFADQDADGQTGSFQQISDDGVIGGYDVVDGAKVLAIWDTSGQQTLLDTIGLPYTEVNWMRMNGAGKITALFMDAESHSSETVLWQEADGEGVVFGSRAWVVSISPNGNMSGQVKHVPTRWIAGESQAIDIPSGQAGGTVAAINDAGDAVVLFGNQTDIISHPPVLWRADGTTQQLEWPPEVVEAAETKHFSATVPVMFENGDFVLNYSIDGEFGPRPLAAIYGSGVPENIQGKASLDMAMIMGASGPDFMIGMDQIWIDGVPQPIGPLVSTPVEISSTNLLDINSKGEIVGTAKLADGATHGVLFRPVG